MATYLVTLRIAVEVEINDESAILRCTENHDDQGVPQPGGSQTGWRHSIADLKTRDEVICYLARLHLGAGYRDASRADGWADLPEGAVTMSINHIDGKPMWPIERLG